MINILLMSARAAAASLSSESVAALGTPGMRLTTSARSVASNPYAPTDNVSELTARINDDGWPTAYANWLRGSRIRAEDAVLVFSVGGGDAEKNISANIVEALKLSKFVGARVIGVVGRDGGYTARGR